MVVTSVVLPACIYGMLLVKRAISPWTVMLLGLALVMIAGLDVYFLQSLSVAVTSSPSLADDAVFVSEVSVALYLLPAMFAGVGINLMSHVLVRHLVEAEQRFRNEHPGR